MMDYSQESWDIPCPGSKCRKPALGLAFVSIPVSLGDDSQGSKSAPKKGNYSNAIVRYEVNGAVYIYSAEGVPVKVKEGE